MIEIIKNMKSNRMKFFLFVLILGFSALGCGKSTTGYNYCKDRTPAQDEPLILAYLSTNNITGYVKDTSGLYYKVDSTGSGVVPNLNSKIYCTYTGRFVDNTIFQQLTDSTQTGWVLGTLIKGWQLGLPKIAKGGYIRLFIPSALAYGCSGSGNIPANVVVVFSVHLTDVQ
jgi:FKBP-type peptidyl-prolyl cis-trans isomerase FkpA